MSEWQGFWMLCEVSEDGVEDCNSYSAQKKQKQKINKKLNVIDKNIFVYMCVCWGLCLLVRIS